MTVGYRIRRSRAIEVRNRKGGPRILASVSTLLRQPPVLTSASGARSGVGTANLSVSTDTGSGTIYWVVTTNSSTPTAAQVKAGNDASGSAGTDSGSIAVVSSGAQNDSASGLTAVTYYVFFMHEAEGQSNIASDDWEQFTPADLNAELWLDPSDLSSLWQNTAGTTPVAANDDLVGRMNNKGSAGSGMNALQGTSSLKPRYQTDGTLHWLLPDGVDDTLTAGAMGDILTREAYDSMAAFVVNSIGTDSDDSLAYANDPIWIDASQLAGMLYRSTGPRLQSYNWDGNSDVAGQNFSTATAYVVRQRHASGTLYQSINGAAEVSAASGNTSAAVLTAMLQLFRSGSAYADVKFYGMVMRKTAFTNDEATNLWTWLGAKAGLSL